MPADRFAAMLRALTATPSRRSTLRALGGLGLAGLVGPVQAKKKHKKKPCPPCKKRKKGKCKGTLPDGAACEGGTCQSGGCVEPVCGAGGPCWVFLSSILYDGNLGGLSGADAKCQGLAAAAGLPGTYKAWLSDTTSSPASRFVPSSGPYQLVNGTTIAANWADLTDGNLAAPISVTETGGGVGATDNTWTYTRMDGTPGGINNVHCKNWSTTAPISGGDVGVANFSDNFWTQADGSSCNSACHLYCFQQS
jgi:hypothetical protein